MAQKMELSADPRYFHGLRQFSFPLILRQWKSRRPTRGGGAIVMELQIGGAQIGGVQIQVLQLVKQDEALKVGAQAKGALADAVENAVHVDSEQA